MQNESRQNESRQNESRQNESRQNEATPTLDQRVAFHLLLKKQRNILSVQNNINTTIFTVFIQI